MIKEIIQVQRPLGLHLREAENLYREAIRFRSQIKLSAGSSTANAKSMLSVASACVRCGDMVELSCEGTDEAEAMVVLREFLSDTRG